MNDLIEQLRECADILEREQGTVAEMKTLLARITAAAAWELEGVNPKWSVEFWQAMRSAQTLLRKLEE